ncbi:MAG: MFS transporter, partial [Polyangiaceae bacterium]|nr:MFS transporter [Polyangiaceae bacterium]
LARPLAGIAVVPVHILAVRVVDRVGKGIRSSPRDALIAASVPATEAGRAFGLQRALDHAGAVIGPLVAAVLIKAGFEMREVFLLAAIPAGLAVLSLAFVREDAREPAPARKPSAAVPLSPRLRRYLAIVFLFSLGNSTDAFLLLRARSIGVSEAALPLLWAVLHVSKVLSAYVGGGAADRMARPRLIALGWVVYGLAYIGLGFASTEWHAFALFAFYGTYYGLTEPAEKALVGELAPEGGRGRAFGAYNFLVGVSAIPAGLLTGIIWQRVSPLAALSVGAAIAAVAMVLLLDWERRA